MGFPLPAVSAPYASAARQHDAPVCAGSVTVTASSISASGKTATVNYATADGTAVAPEAVSRSLRLVMKAW